MHLLEEKLNEIYLAENALVKALPMMIENGTSSELIDALTSHFTETKEQVARLEEVFLTFGEKAASEKCEAISGLIKESEAIIQACEGPSLKEAEIKTAAEKIEHYEIETYRSLIPFSDTLSLSEAILLLKENFEDEKAAEEKKPIIKL